MRRRYKASWLSSRWINNLFILNYRDNCDDDSNDKDNHEEDYTHSRVHAGIMIIGKSVQKEVHQPEGREEKTKEEPYQQINQNPDHNKQVQILQNHRYYGFDFIRSVLSIVTTFRCRCRQLIIMVMSKWVLMANNGGSHVDLHCGRGKDRLLRTTRAKQLKIRCKQKRNIIAMSNF